MFGKWSFCEGYRLDLGEQNLDFPLFTIWYSFLLPVDAWTSYIIAHKSPKSSNFPSLSAHTCSSIRATVPSQDTVVLGLFALVFGQYR